MTWTVPLPEWLLPLAPLLAIFGLLALGFALLSVKGRRPSWALCAGALGLSAFGVAVAVQGRALQIGPFDVEGFGVGLLAGLALGIWFAHRLADSAGLNRASGADALYAALLGALLFARLLDAFGSPRPQTLLGILDLTAGGLSGYGALIGATLSAVMVWVRRNEPLNAWLDVGLQSALLTIGVTRLGCYLTGCDFGKPLRPDAPDWLAALGTASARGGPPLHPTQLYEGFGALLLCVACLSLRRFQRGHGNLWPVAAAGYAALRLVVEPLRGDLDRGFLAGLSTSTWCALGTLLVVLATLGARTLSQRAARSI